MDRVTVQRPDGVTQIMGPPELGWQVTHRRFLLYRHTDISGISGTGVVAEGIRFSDGRAVIRWVVGFRSTAIYDSISELMDIHGHNGATELRWIDGGETPAAEG